MVFLDLHACTSYVNDLEDDFVPKHGSGITDPRLESFNHKSKICLEGGSGRGWFCEVGHAVRRHVRRMWSAIQWSENLLLQRHIPLPISQNVFGFAETLRQNSLANVMTTSCASKFCNNAMPKCLGEIRHGSFGEHFVRYMVDSPLVWMCATDAVSTAAGNPMHVVDTSEG